MNKPILAAATGVTFGLFLGALFMSGHLRPQCHRARVGAVEGQRVIVQRPPCQAPRIVETPPIEANSPDTTLTIAQTEYVNGNYQSAITLARTAVNDSPVRAWRIVGAAACQQKDAKLATDAFRHLDAAGRQYLVYVCQRNGLSSHGRQFKLED